MSRVMTFRVLKIAALEKESKKYLERGMPEMARSKWAQSQKLRSRPLPVKPTTRPLPVK